MIERQFAAFGRAAGATNATMLPDLGGAAQAMDDLVGREGLEPSTKGL